MKKETEREFLAKYKYAAKVLDSELPAIQQVMRLEILGVTITHEHIDRELTLHREHLQRRFEMEVQNGGQNGG